MPPAARSARKKQQAQQSYDLVVASYMLGELHSPQERAALVRRLWGEHTARTCTLRSKHGVLALMSAVHPCTAPAGFVKPCLQHHGQLSSSERQLAQVCPTSFLRLLHCLLSWQE